MLENVDYVTDSQCICAPVGIGVKLDIRPK